MAEGEYPWFVELYARNGGRNGERFCAGVMISGNTFITTARCTYTLNGIRANPSESIAIIKRNNVKRGEGIERNWDVVREHPDYVFGGLVNNVAVVTITGRALFPQEDVGDLLYPDENSTVTAVSYGETSPGGGLSGTLKKGDFRIMGTYFPCDIPTDNTLMCADTVGALPSESAKSSSKDSGKSGNGCDFVDPKLCPPTPAPTVFVPDGDVDFCVGDEGAPLTRGDRQLYGLYIEGGSCNGRAPTAAVLVKIADLRSWILATACEISGTRCAGGCSLLNELSLTAGGAASKAIATVGSVFNWMTGPFRRQDGE